MATSDYGKTYSPNLTGVAANVPVEMGLMSESLEGRTIMSFTDISARDTAVGTLTTTQKKGLVCHVQTGTGTGWWAYSGTVWYQFSILGLTHNRGTAQGSCDINGIMSVNHGLPVAPVSVQLTMEGDNPQIRYLSPVVVLIDSTRFLAKFWYNDPASGSLQLNSGAWTSFHWRAEI